MNAKYARLNEGVIEYAPSVLAADGEIKVNPTEASYLAAGWKRVVDEPPTPEEGMDVVPSSWAEDETTVRRVYKQVAHVAESPLEAASAEPGHRTLSKLKLVSALKAADKWVLVKTWLEEKSYYDYYLAAQDFSEDHPIFAEALAALKEYARITDEEVESIIAQCVAD